MKQYTNLWLAMALFVATTAVLSSTSFSEWSIVAVIPMAAGFKLLEDWLHDQHEEQSVDRWGEQLEDRCE